MGDTSRVDRELDTRVTKTRKRSWERPEVLPRPEKQDGYEYRWIRISTRGTPDATNVSAKLREGWEPVKAQDHPEIFTDSIIDDRFKDNVVVGGLMLCKAPKELVVERTEHFAKQTEGQIQSVDNNLMRENDPRMPLFHDRKSKVTFGTGN